MYSMRIRLARVILATTTSLFVPAVAHAQSQPAVLLPELAVTSPGGVDMATGFYRHEGVDLSIGNESNGGIDFRRVETGAKPFTSNWHIFLNKDCDRAPGSSPQTPCTVTWKLESLAVTKTWLQNSPSTLLVEQGIPSPGVTKLEYNSTLGHQFTMADGSLIQFQNDPNGDVWVTSMTRKDGVVYAYTYDTGGDAEDGTGRLRRVKSGGGYELILEYSGTGNDRITKACVFNAATITPPSALVCPTGAQSVSYSYSGNRVASITDAVGKVWTITHGTGTATYSKPGVSTPWMTNTTTTVGSGFGHPVVASQTFADGRTIAYSYTDLDPGISDPPVIGLKSGRGTSWTVNGSATTELAWDAYQALPETPLFISPAPLTVTDPLGRTSGFTFFGGRTFPHAQLTSKAIIGGRSESFAYSGTNVASRTLNPRAGSGDSPLTTSYTYNCTVTFNCAKPITVQDPKSNVTDYTYSATTGLMLTETMPADANGVRPQKRYTWAPFQARYKNVDGAQVNGNLIQLLTEISECRTSASCVGTADETRTLFSYPTASVMNNLLPLSKTVRSGDGALVATTTFTYDDAGNKIAEDGPLGGTGDTSRWAYDAKRRVTHTMSPDPDGSGTLKPLAVRNTFDDAGRLIKVENGTVPSLATDWAGFVALDNVETDYDALDRKTQERKKDATGTVHALTQYSYDGFGRLECTAVRMNPTGSIPASACTHSANSGQGTTPFDRITRRTYDAGDQLLTVTEAYGTPVQAVEVTYTYSLGGKKATLTDARGFKASMTYDGHDRQTRWNFPDKTLTGTVSGSDYEEYSYDANGNRTSLRKRDGSVLTLAYDNLNRMVTKVVPGTTTWTRDVYMAYDLQGHQTSARFDSQSGEGLVSDYDALGRLKLTTLTMDGVSRSLNYGYDIRGVRTSVTHPDAASFNYSYDTLGRLLQINDDKATLRGYGYDANGRLQAGDLGNGVPGNTLYQYDAIGRLSSLSHSFASGGTANVGWSFTYNPASQLLTQSRANDAYAWTGAVAVNRSYTANGLNQYTAAGAASLTYDANGNLTGDGSSTYTYDVENRLVAASVGAQTVGLRYDPLGRLYEVTGSTSGTTRFLYDGDELVGEYSSVGAQLKRYVHGSAVDDPVVQYEGSGTNSTALRYLQADRQGSIVAVANSSGGIIARNAYDEYGIPKSDQPGQLVVGRFAYTGQIWVPELGMYHYKARLYSPTLGRFLQTDPIGYEDQVNLYAYVGNDPANANDPTGEECNSNYTECWSNSYLSSRSVDLDDNVSDVVIRDGGRSLSSGKLGTEPSGAIVQGVSGLSAVAREPTSSRVPSNRWDDGTGTRQTVQRTTSDRALVHGHVGGTIVDDTSISPRGDSSTFYGKNPVPNYKWEGGRLGVHHAPGGQIRMKMLIGAMTPEEARKQDENIQKEQKLLDKTFMPEPEPE